MLNKEEISRYSRHISLSQIGIAGQEKLKAAKILVIGAGGLGCPILQYITAAGVGEIGIVDFDTVEESNLQRQLLFNNEDIGKFKSEVAAEKLKKQNPYIKFNIHNLELNNQNAIQIFNNYDVIIDGTDNFSTRYLINDACYILKKPLIYGSIYKFEGQVSLFNFLEKNGTLGPNYRCLFPEPPSPEVAPNCSEIGVLGVLPGIIGALQANEALKLVLNIGENLSGKLLHFDALSMAFYKMDIYNNNVEILIPGNENEFENFDYNFFCGLSANLKSISADELVIFLHNKDCIQLLDVRETDEIPIISELKDLSIPLSKIEEKVSSISKDKKVIVYCKSGKRSKAAINLLQTKFKFNNLYNLDGGINKWLTKTK